MSKKIALTSDWHCHNYAGAQVRTLEDGTNSRLKDILDCGAWMVDVALKRKAGAMIHGGDLTHNRRFVHVSALARTAKALREFNAKLPMDVLEGNHDQDQTGDGTSSVAAFEGIIRAHTRSEVTTVLGVKVGWLPYTNDPAVVRAETARLAKAGARLLIAHLGIGDPKHANCLPVDYETPGAINVSDLNADKFEQVFLGHYHTAQDLAENVRYIGSPLQLSFKEAGINKGFWIWDADANEVEWIDNEISPQYHIIEPGKAMDVGPRDFVWYRGFDAAATEELRTLNADRAVPARIDAAPKLAAAARLSKEATTDRAMFEEYVRILRPKAEPGEIKALVDRATALVGEVDGHGTE